MTTRFVRARFAHLLFAGTALSILSATPALAHAAKVPAPAQDLVAQGDEPQQDGEIVVTATRRAESAKDVPVAVTAIGGEKLDVINSGGLDIRFLAARVPSLQAESSFGRTFPRFYIRGLGNTDFDPNAQQPVSVVYDDVALENPMLKAFPVFDLESVEVLRGPQGTLFGRNTPAGVIKLDSAKPKDDKVSGFFNFSLGTFMTVNSQAAVNLPLGNGWALRVSAIDQSRDGYVKNTLATGGSPNKNLEGYQDVAGRVQLGYSGGDFNLLLNLHGRDLDGTPRIFRAGVIRPGTAQFNTGFDPRRVSLDGYTSQSAKQWGANARLDYHFDGAGTLYSVTAFEKADVESTGDIDGGSCYSFIPGCNIGTINVGLFPSNTGGTTTPEEFSQELRFVSDDLSGFVLQGGAYYFHQKLGYHEYAYAAATSSRRGNLIQDVFHDNRAENYGIFAAVDWKATDALTLRAGGRYSHDRKHDIITGYSADVTPGHPFPQEARVSDGEFTWDVNATYAVSKAVNLYARAATGYLGPAIQDRWSFGSFQLTKPKQTTLSFEGGIKGGMPGLNFALDGYYHRTNDLQLTQVGGSGNTARLLSVDKAVGYGVEAEIEARPTPHLQLTASGSYNHTEMQSPGLGVSYCATCTVLDPIVGGQAIIDGNDLPQAPRWVANWTARYGVPVGDGEIYAYTDWAYRSSINFFLYDSIEFTGREQLEGGLKIAYNTGHGLEVGAFARNITNQYRIISGIDFNNLTGMISEPRIIGGLASVKF